MELRPHQIEAVDSIRQAMREGHKRIMLGANVSFGKTIVAAHMMIEANNKGKRGVFICDRIQLIEQTVQKFEQAGLNCGVIQGIHEKTNPSAPIQIASIQTLARRKMMLEFDFAIVDEAHTHYESLTKMMELYNNVPFIGLSATPYSKGLGKYYSKLIVPITTRELLEKGYLCPVKYYAGEQPDLETIKIKRDKNGIADYDPDQLSLAMEKPKLIGDAVETWLKLGEDSQTIAFCPSISHSRGLAEAFNYAGVKAMHVDAYTEPEIRKDIYARHDAGEFKILSCSSLLNTGYDSPSTRCIIDCYPTKSIIRYVQRVGREMRTFGGKEYAIYLDHSSNVCRHGFAEDIVPDSLHDGTKEYSEASLTKDKKESNPVVCECCSAIMAAGKCLVCGHEIKRKKKDLEQVKGELKEVQVVDQEFYSGLIHHAKNKGYSAGWAKHKYKEKFGSWPIGANEIAAVSSKVDGYIKHLNIKYAHAKKKNESVAKETVGKLMEMFNV
ncbi:MAG: DEAD/DEAH box helicase [Cellvibrio sp.]|nr:DEAD/DEAH box helicase [Cellvibrio sp.]